jgi:predicted amidohydrolase
VSGIAATTSTFIVSVPRPAPEGSLDLGGEAFVISPTGEVLTSSNDDICTCDIDLVELGKARVNSYPGYLNVRAEDYATAWNKVSLYQKGFKSNY